MERFLHPGRFSVASIYAPISFPPLPLIVLKKAEEDAAPAVAAVGSLKSIDPDRIILKRVILTGCVLLALSSGHLIYRLHCCLWQEKSNNKCQIHIYGVFIKWQENVFGIFEICYVLWCSYPQRVSKRKASVRHMFYNPEDVRWFKVRNYYLVSRMLGF